MTYKEDNAKGKSIVGKVRNDKFAFFWLLIGGSVGDIVLILYSLNLWLILLPSLILTLLIAVAMADKKQRPKRLLGIDILGTIAPAIVVVSSVSQLAIFLPSALIIFGCVLGIMDW